MGIDAANSTVRSPEGRVLRRATLRRVMLALLFIGFLYPISVAGIGVNYSFVLLPLVVVIASHRPRHPSDMLLLAAAVYVLIFFAALIYQVELVDLSGRRFVSFAVYMTMFAFAFVSVSEEMKDAFKDALIVISLYFSLLSVYLLFVAGGANLGFEAKDIVGSQRYGFIYLLAIWIVLIDPARRRALGILWYPVLLGLLAGLLLTFSRSSIVALVGSYGLYLITVSSQWSSRVHIKSVFKAVAWVLAGAATVAVLYRTFPVAFEFFSVRLLDFFANADTVKAHLGDASTSEGTRVAIAEQIIDYVARNPFTGSGFLGIWALPGSAMGSAHNQLLDVLLRTGVPGFFLYAMLLLSLLKCLFLRERALFWGVVSVLIYGMFHETFKESQGTFALAFLLGMMADEWRRRRLRENRAEQWHSEPASA